MRRWCTHWYQCSVPTTRSSITSNSDFFYSWNKAAELLAGPDKNGTSSGLNALKGLNCLADKHLRELDAVVATVSSAVSMPAFEDLFMNMSVL